MTDVAVKLRLNAQQLELLDRSVQEGQAESRSDLVRRALREFAAAHPPTAAAPANRGATAAPDSAGGAAGGRS